LSDKKDKRLASNGVEHDEDVDRRRYNRRSGIERRGALRWDPKADERRRRSEIERRRLTIH
jgi:hypothetical protein